LPSGEKGDHRAHVETRSGFAFVVIMENQTPEKFAPPISFESHYPIPSTKKIISNAFKKRGLIPSTMRDKRCLVQWTPRSKISFDRAHSNTLLISSFFINQGLTHKDRLFAAHSKKSAISWAVPVTHTIPPHSTKEELLEAVDMFIGSSSDSNTTTTTTTTTTTATSTGWILKRSQVNNALGLIVFNDITDLKQQLNNINDFKPCKTKSVLQEYIKKPLLLKGKKFHLRINVLVTGGDNSVDSLSSNRPQAYIHTDIVAHVASENYVAGDWTNRWVHVTNHGVQRDHPHYDRLKQTLSLDELQKALVEEHGCNDGEYQWNEFGKSILNQASTIVRNVLKTAMERPGDLRPMNNCFECFGFDLIPKLLESDESKIPFCLQLLEINGGPALEGVARPEMCEQIVDDVLCLVLDPWLKKCYDGKKEEEVKECNTGFIKVWERENNAKQLTTANTAAATTTSTTTTSTTTTSTTTTTTATTTTSILKNFSPPNLISNKFILYTNNVIQELKQEKQKEELLRKTDEVTKSIQVNIDKPVERMPLWENGRGFKKESQPDLNTQADLLFRKKKQREARCTVQ
jgi:hypothetical protein